MNRLALVLHTGAHPTLMKTRQLILEAVGHRVVNAWDEQEITVACKSHPFEVAVIGQSMSPEMKQLMAKIIRQVCPCANILELFQPHQGGTLERADSWLAVPASAPKDL